MRELKRKKERERPIDLRPQASVQLGAGQQSRSAFSSFDRRSPDYGARRLTTLLEVARMLTSELDLAEIVRQVLVRAIEVIPAADAGTLYLADSDTGRLIVTDSVGFGRSIFNISLEPGEAAAGRAFVSGRGAIYPDPEAVQEAISNAKPETYREFRKASLRPPKAAMAASLIFKGTRLGALVVDALLGEETFTPTDLSMLEDFAQIAAIAIVNAQLYGSEHTKRMRLEVLNDEITRQRDDLNKRLSALDSMSEIARQELGLHTLANRLADLTSSRAYILDGLTRLRSTERSQSDPDHLKELLRSERCLELMRRVAQDHHRHTAIIDGVQLTVSPIVSGPDLLGYVLLEATAPASPTLNEGLADMAALIASTVFVRERALEEGLVRRRADLLGRLLEGDAPKSASSFKALPPPLRLAVGKVRTNPTNQGQGHTDDNILREVRSIAEQVLRTSATPTVAAVHGDCVVLAWSVAQREGRCNPEKLEAIASLVESSTGAQLRFAVTEVVGDPQLIPQIYQEARLSAEIRPWRTAVVDAAGLGAYRFIIGASSSQHVLDFSRRTLGKVMKHDEKRNGELIGTLRTYLENRSSVSLAAQVLGVHVHTVQYRLSRLEELTGLSMRIAEERLTLELALRILDLAGLGIRQPA
jgi:PucR C-terminal helix-turn-helix domain/GAF domain/GGDEF-like domain